MITCEHCGKEFERQIYATKDKRNFCSKKCMNEALYWSEEDSEILRNNYKKIKYRDMVGMFSKPYTYEEIQRRAGNMKIVESRLWAPEEKQILIDNYHKVSMEEIQQMLPNKSPSAILGQARQLNLKSLHYLTHIYTEADNQYLRDNYLTKTNAELAEVLGHNANGIAQHLWLLKLYRPVDIDNYLNLAKFVRQRNAVWRKEKQKECNRICQISGQQGQTVIHHIYGFNKILSEAISIEDLPPKSKLSDYSEEELNNLLQTFWELQDKYNSYICISKDIHIKFHKLYGYGDNTPEQWDEFIKTYYQ